MLDLAELLHALCQPRDHLGLGERLVVEHAHERAVSVVRRPRVVADERGLLDRIAVLAAHEVVEHRQVVRRVDPRIGADHGRVERAAEA